MILFDVWWKHEPARAVDHLCRRRSPSPMFVDLKVSVPLDEFCYQRNVVFTSVNCVSILHLCDVLSDTGKIFLKCLFY